MAVRKILVGATLVSQCGLLFAASNSLSQFNNQARVAFILQHMNYKETTKRNGFDHTDDTNKGTIPGFGITLRHQFAKVFTAINLNAAHGKIPYKGATTSGNVSIKNNDADSLLLDMSGSLGYTFNLSPKFALIPYFHFGYHTWQRSTSATRVNNTGIIAGQEVYRNNYYAGGLRMEWQLTPAFIVSFYGSYGSTFMGEVFNPKTKLRPGSNVHAGATYHLGNKPWYNGGVDLDYAIWQHLHLFATFDYTHFAYGKSETRNTRPGHPKDGFNEPNSTTRYFTTYLGLGYDFAGDKEPSSSADVSNSVTRINNQAVVSAALFRTDYTLSRENASLRHEIFPGTHTGYLPGLSLAVGKTFAHWYVGAMTHYASGVADFKANFHPYYRTNQANIHHYQGQLATGYFQTFSPNFAILPQVILGYQRDVYIIRKTQFNHTEANVYGFLYSGLGLAVDWQVNKRWVLAPMISGGYTFDNQIDASLTEVQYRSSAAPWYQLGLKSDVALTNNLHLETGLTYRFVKFKQSALSQSKSSPSLSLVMPKAWYRNYEFNIGLGFDFD